MSQITQAGVIGAGVMGSGIAAQLANAGITVTLLDLHPSLAAAGITRQIKAGGFMDSALANRIRTGSIDTDLGLLAGADWIIESAAERLDVKHHIYEAIDDVRKPGSIVSSNTSTILLSKLTEGMKHRFASDFLITHFFNPPRWMRLLELVTGPATRPEAVALIRDFADRCLGKGVVDCKDTPGFIANRIGNFWIAAALHEALVQRLDVEEADAVMSKLFGVAYGVFGLLDLVGIDLLPPVWNSLKSALSLDDPFQVYPAAPALITNLISQGRHGRKTGAGFMRRGPDGKFDVLDLVTGEYRPLRLAAPAALDETRGDLHALISHNSPAGRFAEQVMLRTLAYAASLVPEIADSPDLVDRAMRDGYGWKHGPFQLIDRIGVRRLTDLLSRQNIRVSQFLRYAASEGAFYGVTEGERWCLSPAGLGKRPMVRPDGILLLDDVARKSGPVVHTELASLWDLGDEVGCIELHGKLNIFSSGMLQSLEEMLETGQGRFAGLVIASQAPSFSAGADLREVLKLAEAKNQAELMAFIETGQRVFRMIKFARVPVAVAATGFAYAGGCELLLHAATVEVHANIAMGLVESKVGLIPAWGGCKEMLLRLGDDKTRSREPMAATLAAFDVIRTSQLSTSGYNARAVGFLRPADGISMNVDRVLGEAKARLLRLVKHYVPPQPQSIALSGRAGASALKQFLDIAHEAGHATAHDLVVGEALVEVLTGGAGADPGTAVAEDAISSLERDAFLHLVSFSATRERIRHMVETGKALAN